MNIPTTTIRVAFPVTIEKIAAQLDRLRGIDFTTHYKDGVGAIKVCRDLRGEVEERRKYLKADSIAYGREVDRVAGTLEAAIENVEGPLKAAKRAVDTAKERAKEAAAQAERDRIEGEIRAKRAEEERELRAKRRSEELALEQRRAELEAMKAEIAREREAASFEIKKLQSMQREEDARRAAATALEHAKELAARKIEEAREAELHRQEYEAAQAKRLKALQPDIDKLSDYAAALRVVFESAPEGLDASAQAASDAAANKVGEAIDILEGWQP